MSGVSSQLGLGQSERRKLPVGSGAEPQRKSNFAHFSLKIWHLVASNLLIFLRINWPQCVKSTAKFRGLATSFGGGCVSPSPAWNCNRATVTITVLLLRGSKQTSSGLLKQPIAVHSQLTVLYICTYSLNYGTQKSISELFWWKHYFQQPAVKVKTHIVANSC